MQLLQLAAGVVALGVALAVLVQIVRGAKSGVVTAKELGVAAFAALVVAGYAGHYISASADLMFADFMYFRLVSVLTAKLLGAGQVAGVIQGFITSMKDDYSLLPTLLTGATMAATAPLARWPYELAILAFYALPALFALAWLAREIARRAGVQFPRSSAAALALSVFAVLAAYPNGLTVAVRGMPDVGGLLLFVLALRQGEGLVRALTARPGHDASLAPTIDRLAMALPTTLFALFLFRRWYLFAAVGLAAGMALEIAVAVARGGFARLRLKETLHVAGRVVLLGLVYAAPVLVDWLQNPAAHDYVQIYAAYRKSTPELIALVGQWYGYAVLGGAVLGAFVLAGLSPNARLLRMTWMAAIVAAALFLRVQTPYVHHVYLIAPAITVTIAALLLVALKRFGTPAWAGLGALAVATMTPAISGTTPAGLFPTAALPHAPRADLAELARLRDWFDANARPDHRVCALGSSYTFSDQLIHELWQLDPVRSPLYAHAADRPDVVMAHVDDVQGPPVADIKDCAMMIVGDPVQTHLVPSHQQTVIVPATEMLAGTGLGEKFRRTGEVFKLENAMTAVVFERVAPIEASDVAALQERWRRARVEK